MRNYSILTHTTTSRTVHGSPVVRTSIGTYMVVLDGVRVFSVYEVSKGKWDVVERVLLNYGTPEASEMGVVIHVRPTLNEALAALANSMTPVAA